MRQQGGAIWTRTGRAFFAEEMERAVLARVRAAVGTAGLWEALGTSWLLLDCELMPWSAKAQELLRGQYAAVGAAASAALPPVIAVLEQARAEGVAPLLERMRSRLANAGRFIDAYRRYCWPVASVADLKLAPFHLLASEGKAHLDRDHGWHMETLAALAAHDGVLMATAHREVDLGDEASEASATAWWEELTASGGEGMVVKPMEFVARGPRGLVQPAVKVRGREYLRIIYGPDYDTPENLSRLRQRGLGAKRSLALSEFALGAEALERHAAGDGLRRVHECVFGVLALESEPVDPRL